MNIIKLLVSIILIITSCKGNSNNMKISFHSNAKSEQIKLSDDDFKIVYNKVVNIINNSSEVLRLFVEQSRIDEIKKTDEVIEFTFPKVTKITSNSLGEKSFTSLLIPVSGDFIGNQKDPVITIFIENSGDYSEPIRNTKGYSAVMEIKIILEKYLSRKK